MIGSDIPAVREEMQRHMEELRTLLMGQRDLVEKVAAEVRPLREKGATAEEIQEAAKKFAPQAEALAGQVVDALAKHHENMAKIFKDNRAEVVKQMAESIVKRMALRDAQRPAPGGEGGQRPNRPRPGGERGQGAPENL